MLTVVSVVTTVRCWGEVDEVRCYHEAGEYPDVYLVPGYEEGDPLSNPLEVDVYNGSGEQLSVNTRLYKSVDDGWVSMMPFPEGLQLTHVAADDSRSWELDMSEDAPDLRSRVFPGSPFDLRYTGSGLYAFVVRVVEPDSVDLVALVEFTGGELEFEPVGVRGSEESDGVVDVEMEEIEGEGEVVLEGRRRDSTEAIDNLDEMRPELLVQMDSVNNLVAFWEDDVERVRFNGDLGLLMHMEQLFEFAEVSSHLIQEDSEAYENAILEPSEDGPVEEFPYQVGFIFDGKYFEITVEQVDGVDS